MKGLQAMLLADFYKLSHREQYPPNTQMVYSTWTPRASKIEGINEVVCFGIQGFIKEYLIEFFNENFFKRDIKSILEEYARTVSNTLGIKKPRTKHIEDLWALGYLPLEIRAVPEGTLVPVRVPMMTIRNTHPKFFWLTNFIETLASCNLWKPSTSATIANEYRKLLEVYAIKTAGDKGFVPFQGHDFSMRGMDSVESASRSGAGHLLSFVGTDIIPAITYLEQYYGANCEKELVGTSIPATEHSVACAYQNDMDYFKRMITEVYPNGFVSIVSDTWDLWDVLRNILPSLKKEIMARDGKMVIRPDSGDPVKIICGNPEATFGSPEYLGVIQMLWNTFGGTVNAKGYKVLDSHIGCIYGDSITLERCKAICEGLERKGFASTNMVYGIGSYTYQYNTRDTFGFALKSTLCVVGDNERQIFKDPKTDNGVKKSQKGRVWVLDINGKIVCVDGLGMKDENAMDMLRVVFQDGKLVRDESLSTIRGRIRGN